MPGGSRDDPADISRGDCRVCTIGREKEGAMTACCCSGERWGVAGEVGRQVDTAGRLYGEYLSCDCGDIISSSPSDLVTHFPLAMLTGNMTSLGWAFLHSTCRAEF